MEIISCVKKEECDRKISKIISEKISDIIQQKENVVLGIPGGRSVHGIFKLLKKENIEWSKVHIFMVDERMVALDDEQSNFRSAKENFIDELVKLGKLPEKNIHPFKVEEGVESYKEELQKLGGKFDLAILGVGEDGHVAALFPNHHSVSSDEKFFSAMDDSPKPPAERISSSVSLLRKSSVGVVLFYGEEKRKAYEMFNDKNFNFEQCPAKLVFDIGRVYVVTNLKKNLR